MIFFLFSQRVFNKSDIVYKKIKSTCTTGMTIFLHLLCILICTLLSVYIYKTYNIKVYKTIAKPHIYNYFISGFRDCKLLIISHCFFFGLMSLIISSPSLQVSL